MKRWLLHIFACISLLLCVAMVVLWVRSYRYTARVFDQEHGTAFGCVALHGRVAFTGVWGKGMPAEADGWQCDLSLPATSFEPTDWFIRNRHVIGGFGTAYGRTVSTKTTYGLILELPSWAAVLLTLVLPGLWLGAHLRLRREQYRRTHGLCLECGYDLRASKDKCTECGTPIPPNLARKPLE